MRPGRPLLNTLTRRALGTRFVGAAAAMGYGPAMAATEAIAAPQGLTGDLRDAALRGLALASFRGDPVAAAEAEAVLARLTETDPEAALLVRIYRLRDVRPAAYWQPDSADAQPAATANLALLHAAIAARQPIRFSYTDLSDQITTRSVLPLVLVHPAQGVKLLGWCEARQDFRQFFVRSMQDVTAQPGDFSAERLALLEALLDKESGWS